MIPVRSRLNVRLLPAIVIISLLLVFALGQFLGWWSGAISPVWFLALAASWGTVLLAVASGRRARTDRAGHQAVPARDVVSVGLDLVPPAAGTLIGLGGLLSAYPVAVVAGPAVALLLGEILRRVRPSSMYQDFQRITAASVSVALALAVLAILTLQAR